MIKLNHLIQLHHLKLTNTKIKKIDLKQLVVSIE